MILGIIAFLFLAAVISQWIDTHTTEILLSVVGIVAIICIVGYLKRRRETPKYKEEPITKLDPPWEELSGTFKCPDCGGATSFQKEVNPSTKCSFCGSDIPQIKIMILERNQRRQELITRDLENQQRDRKERFNEYQEHLDEFRYVKQVERNKMLRDVAVIVGMIAVVYLLNLFIGKH